MGKTHRPAFAIGIGSILLIAACGASESADPSSTSTSQDVPAQTSPTPTTTSAATVEAPELGGTSWIVADYSQGSGAITNVWKTDVTIAFSEDGTVTGSAGCNEYQAAWAVSGAWDDFTPGQPDVNDGQVLQLSDLSWTEVACEDEDIMVQEGEILDLLQRAGRWVLIRDEFHLRDAEGAFLFSAQSV